MNRKERRIRRRLSKKPPEYIALALSIYCARMAVKLNEIRSRYPIPSFRPGGIHSSAGGEYILPKKFRE